MPLPQREVEELSELLRQAKAPADGRVSVVVDVVGRA